MADNDKGAGVRGVVGNPVSRKCSSMSASSCLQTKEKIKWPTMHQSRERGDKPFAAYILTIICTSSSYWPPQFIAPIAVFEKSARSNRRKQRFALIAFTRDPRWPCSVQETPVSRDFQEMNVKCWHAQLVAKFAACFSDGPTTHIELNSCCLRLRLPEGAIPSFLDIWFRPFCSLIRSISPAADLVFSQSWSSVCSWGSAPEVVLPRSDGIN